MGRFNKLIAKYKWLAPVLFLMPLLACINTCKAVSQHVTSPIIVQGDTIFAKADKPPVFPGGPVAFIKYLSKSVRYPEAMRDRGVEGKVIAQFVVETDGSISNIKILDGPGYGSSEEATRVLKKSPKWQPGYNKGKPVRVQFKVPIDFVEKNPPSGGSGFKVING